MAKYYYEQTFELKSLPGISFKILQLNPSELLTISMASEQAFKKDLEVTKTVNDKIFEQYQWSKSSGVWNPLMNDNGTCRLDEVASNVKILMELVAKFQIMVISPAFLE